MAQYTLLIFLGLIVKSRNSRRRGTGQYGRVAFQAKLIGLRTQKHVGICGAVRAMARHTTLLLKRRVLENERARRIDMASGAHCSLA